MDATGGIELGKNISKWNNEDIKLLITYCKSDKTINEMYLLFNKRYKTEAIRYKCKTLGFNYSNRWTDEENQILIDNHINKTYKDLQILLPNRTRDSIASQCQRLKLPIKDSKLTWTKEEIDILILNYNNKSKTELIELFPNKPYSSIKSKREQLKLYKNDDIMTSVKKSNSLKNPLYWDNNKKEILINHFNEFGLVGIYDLFPKHRIKFINKKLREYNLIKDTDLNIIRKYSSKDLNNYTLGDKLNIYRKILNNEMAGFSDINLKKEDIIFCFKYYLYSNNIQFSRDEWLQICLGDILSQSKLIHIIKRIFNNYYDFITECFPHYRFKHWEFKLLNVSDGYWTNKYNCFNCIKYGLDKMINDNLIHEYQDILGVSHQIIEKYFSLTMMYYYGNKIFLDYFDFNKMDYSKYNYKVADGFIFDSKEEKDIYIQLKKLCSKVIKCNFKEHKLLNKKYNENYIPDFLINDKIITEYYGMYKDNPPNNIFKDYKEKTIRKNEYYKSNNFLFIDLYPEDIKNNFAGLKRKFESFFMQNFNIKLPLEGGEIIE